MVSMLAQSGPAYRAGVRRGDYVLAVANRPVSSLAELFRQIWSVGPAGSEVPLTLGRGEETLHVRVQSADRNEFLLKPRQH
jgi:S1-C subfamily serine protease